MGAAVRRAVAIVIGLGSCSVTWAQQTNTPSPILEEVVVTAQKRDERLIDVPTAVTELQASDLLSQNLVDMYSFHSRVPGLSYAGVQTTDLALRGITTGGATNPTLAILLDDIPFGSTTVAGLGNSRFPDFDPALLERIEVLHGPQGTLYGAASLGGLIKYVTRQPDTQRFFGSAEAGMESVDRGSSGFFVRGTLNAPLVSDKLAFLVSAFDRQDPPYIDNVNPTYAATNINKTHTYGGYASLLFKPTDGLVITLAALDQRRSAEFSTSVHVNTDANGYPTWVNPYGENNVSLTPTSDIGEQKLYSARIVWDFAGLEFTSLSSYSESTGTNLQDITSVFFFLLPQYGYPPMGSAATIHINDAQLGKKVTQEFRLAGKLTNVFDWRVGLFYTHEYGSVDQSLLLYDPAGSQQATPYAATGPNDYTERAAFADATFHVTDKFEIEAGVRYSKNDQVIGGGTTTIDPPAVPIFGPSNTAPQLTSSDNSTTWAFSPVYHFTPDLMTYFRAASGYRPGGPNTVLPNVPAAFKPDTVVNYEVGFKGIAADRKFSWDAAVFQINWKDVQLQDTDVATQFTYTTNGGGARSRGVEGELNWLPLAGLNVGANMTFLDAVLTEALPALSGADSLVGNSGDRLPWSARFSSNVFAQDTFQISGNLSGFAGVNWSYVGSRYTDFTSTGATLPRFQLPSYSLVDLNAGLEYGGNWRLNIFLRNVANEHGVVTANNRNGTSPTTFADFTQPRTVGASIGYRF
jgi:outer membrane receptor protein involved in Fe transport